MSGPPTREILLARLDAIAASVASRDTGLALLGLGSCAEPGRLDGCSDLDFFVIVADGAKVAWVEDLSWLEQACALAWAHRNTRDGWKTLDGAGVLCEFAVFEPGELATIPFAPGQLIWARDGFDAGLVAPRARPGPVDPAWETREAKSNLLVGLMRLARGEATAGWQSICVHAAAHARRALTRWGEGSDPFDPARRIEVREPALAALCAIWRGPDPVAVADSMLRALDARTGADAMSAAITARAAALRDPDAA